MTSIGDGTLAAHFAGLSLLAVGGVNTIIPEIHRIVVERYGLMTDPEFADLFAIARASPGPNMLIVSLIGWKAAGLRGAALTTAAICAPPALLTFAIARLWTRFREASWRRAIEGGLVPITVGFVLASGCVLTGAADHSTVAFGVTAATALVVVRTKLSPLWMLAVAALLGGVGAV